MRLCTDTFDLRCREPDPAYWHAYDRWLSERFPEEEADEEEEAEDEEWYRMTYPDYDPESGEDPPFGTAPEYFEVCAEGIEERFDNGFAAYRFARALAGRSAGVMVYTDR